MQRLGRSVALLMHQQRCITAEIMQQVLRAQGTTVPIKLQGALQQQLHSEIGAQVQLLHSQATAWLLPPLHTSDRCGTSGSSNSKGSCIWHCTPNSLWLAQGGRPSHPSTLIQQHCRCSSPSNTSRGYASTSSNYIQHSNSSSSSVAADPLPGTSPASTAVKPPPPQARPGQATPLSSCRPAGGIKKRTKEAPKKPVIGICKRRNIRCGWKKIDFVLRMIRRSTVDDAMAQLAANPKRAAVFVLHAVANARNNAIYAGGDPKKLYVAEAFVTRAQYKKRIHFMSKGYSSIKEKQFSHLNVKVLPMDDVMVAKMTLRPSPRLIAPLMERMHDRQRQPQRQRLLERSGSGADGGGARRRQQRQHAARA